MASKLDSGSSGPGSSPGQGHLSRALRQDTLTLKVFSLHTGIKIGTGEFDAGGSPAIGYHPEGSRIITSRFMLWKPG